MIPNFKKSRVQYLGGHANLKEPGEYLLLKNYNTTGNLMLDVMSNYNHISNTAMKLCISFTYKGSNISLLSLKENVADLFTKVDVLSTSDGSVRYIAVYYNHNFENIVTYRAESAPRVIVENPYSDNYITYNMKFMKQEDLGITLTTQSTLTIG